MIPILYNHRKEKGKLRRVTDFDLPYAYHNLTCVTRGVVRSKWKPPLWINLLMAAIAVAIGFGLWIAAQHDPFALQSSFAAKLILGLIGMLFFVVAIYLGFLSLIRGQLVLDRASRELHFYRFWFSISPHRRRKSR